MSAILDRQNREILRRYEARLRALEEGIARHEARVAELREIRDRVAAERDELLAKVAPAAAEPAPEAPAAPLRGDGLTAGRAGVKSGPPPEAEPVKESPDQFWSKVWNQAEKRPQIVYPWSPTAGVESPPEQTAS